MTAFRPTSGRGRGSDDEGVAAVEFALVVPLLVVLLYLAVLAGSIYLDQLQIQAAARNGARVGSVVPSSACSTALEDLAGNNVGTVQCTVAKTCAAGAMQVQLTTVQSVTIPLIGQRRVMLHASSSFACNT